MAHVLQYTLQAMELTAPSHESNRALHICQGKSTLVQSILVFVCVCVCMFMSAAQTFTAAAARGAMSLLNQQL